ncbi:MAG: hypothetical protein KatS3mg003_1976 [Candidatus Nitrosocaldaceae archaeon]|nr:MAG: hypothetical protein KatS3mg003_1976 [Candidatus Nitrosocaldaceae archaeon]
MNVEQEDVHFKIFDDNNYLLAYFQPDYGNIYPKEREEEIIQNMIKNKEEITEGLLYLPMLKFNIGEEEYDIEVIKQLLELALAKLNGWINTLREIEEIKNVRVVKSHTDPDMLALLLDIKFKESVRLNSREMNEMIFNILRRFMDNRLL